MQFWTNMHWVEVFYFIFFDHVRRAKRHLYLGGRCGLYDLNEVWGGVYDTISCFCMMYPLGGLVEQSANRKIGGVFFGN